MEQRKDLVLIYKARLNLIIFFVAVLIVNFLFVPMRTLNPELINSIYKYSGLSDVWISLIFRFILMFLVINLALLLKFWIWTIILYAIGSLLPILFWIPVIVLLYHSKRVLKAKSTLIPK